IPALLAPLGLAMENLGDIDRQTIAGAISTGTHGTGVAFGGIATQVRALKIVTGTGELVILSPELTPDIWAGSVVGLGALGIVVEVTLQCVDAFEIIAAERSLPLDQAFARLGEHEHPEEQFEFYWFPGTESAASKLNRRAPRYNFEQSGAYATVGGQRNAFRAWFDDEFMANGLFQATNSLGTLFPGIIPTVNGIAANSMANNTFRAPSHEVLVRPRRVRFREMEYAFDLEVIPQVFAELRQMIEKKDWKISFPVELRVAAADDLWLSTAYGRTTGYIAIHRFWREDPGEYFSAFEEIAKAYDGRPHWGKMHYRDAENLRASYPKFDDFVKLRNAFDPDRIFTNTYLNRVLGG
ncbi:MAG: D-arabinono-1,4-lactone oxidase, partial [Microbacteriaceae bacterium]